ncbi:Ribosome-recycling factor [Flexistipes sinusarabici DSM 4947]|uniref:Ribosome-recycling factor n=2 Tax=Flexistipes sinusarabici TaxID=2352 RepID=F8E6T1_FLESM|nr:ribosome recycling factor [Flexistipes sinusarabici]AEI13717.1 Ribosome-recycling factor [Flexistipes sinusarabici DSM 4947]HCW92683.1 ribosome recycling factor [Flexistipes sinusarabici]
MYNDVIKDLKKQMKKTLEHYRDELRSVRTGRASVTMFDNVKVNYYGTPTPVSQVATLQAPDARLVTIQPWDPNMIAEIEKAIQSSNMGFNPSNDGTIIRVPIPQLTEERRKEIMKMVKKMSEEAKIAIRNERRSGNEDIKKLEKEKEISEDDAKKALEQIQNLTDEYIDKIDELTSKKEDEVMQI